MASLRLTFLYPQLFRCIRLGGATKPITTKPRCQGRSRRAAAFSTSAPVKQATFKRHGKAVEPIPTADAIHLPEPEQVQKPQLDPATSRTVAEQAASSVKSQPKNVGPPKKEGQDVGNKGDTLPEQSYETAGSSSTPQQEATDAKMKESGPMEAVLHMPPPDTNSHPHISPPPYFHHFDSYSLVKQLESGGYTKVQAITVMKGVRSLLAQNLDVAQDGLVSKIDVDNETYLFKAACSELSSEVKNNRRSADESSRQQRTVLQHEVDILTQKLNQDLLTLKDDVKGAFNDRKMAVREEQKTIDSAVQQLNLKISVTLASDAKSEIEGVRWVLIRRSVIGILIMVIITLAMLRYTTYMGHERQRQAEQKAREAEERKRNNGRVDFSPAPDAAEILAAN